MCLDKLTGKRTLNKDKVVWKAMGYHGEKAYRGFFKSGFICKMQEKHSAILVPIKHGGISYISGFHCFTKRLDALRLARESGGACIRCIIPKGNEVQYGKERWNYDNVSVVVTPELFFCEEVK